MIKKFFIIVIIILPLTGCYNYQELKDLTVVTAMGIDYDSNNNMYNISYEAINTNLGNENSGNNNQSNFLIYNIQDKTIEMTAKKAANTTSKKLYVSHLEVLILSEEVAKNHLREVIEFIFKNPEFRTEFYILVAKNNTPKDILEILTPLLNINSENIKNSLKNSSRTMGISELVTFRNLLNKFLNYNIEISIPTVEIKGKTPNKGENNSESAQNGDDISNLERTDAYSNLEISNMSVFKNNQFVGYLNEDESITYNLITNNLKTTIYNYECEKNKYISFELVEVKSSLKPQKNGKVNVKIKGKANIVDLQCKINLSKNKEVKKMKKKLNKDIENYVKDNFYNINRKYNSDIYGIKDKYYKDKLKYYKKIKNDWENYFNNIDLKVKSDIEIFSQGNGEGDLNEMENK